MPATEMIVSVAMFAAVVLALVHAFRLIGTAILHRTVRRAIDKDPAAAEPLIERLAAPTEPQRGDDRLAVLLIAFGVALIAATLVINETSWMRYGIAGALFPLIIGAALWLRLFVIERARRRGAGE